MRRARWAALAAAVLLLAGCSEIPTAGPVQPGTTDGPNDTPIVYLPNPPASGATSREIVAGFLTAAASTRNDFQVARKYLASSFAAKWRPRTGVLVQEAQPTTSGTTDADLTVDVPFSGVVDAAGVYSPTSGSRPLVFHLVREGGQWRIDSAPNGIVLSQTVFQGRYTPKDLQFFDPTWTRLVPDRRWFPVTTGPETTVRSLAAGPRGPIAGGVAVNALQGVGVGSVTTDDDDVTTVVLSTGGRSPSAETVGRMQQQLAQTLPLQSPSALRLVVNGQTASQTKPLTNQAVSLNPFVVADGRFGTLGSDGTVTADRQLGARVAASRPRAVTVSTGQQLAAVLTAVRQVAAVTPSGVRVVDPRTGLIAPTLDQRGWIYSVPADDPGGLVAADAKGKGGAKDLVADIAGSSITSIEVSPDGTRMLVLVVRASGPAAFVAGIERNPDGAPTGLSDAHYAVSLGGGGGSVDATWVDDSSVAVLTSGTTDRVRVQRLGGLSQELGPLTGATSIVGVPSLQYLRVRLQSGDVWRWTGSVWQSEAATPLNVDVLAVQR
ncbi:hypothetical protein [uncultured Amnibacterium sp.]|uniref:hypothetical protein n=1 Tax=uncultured Amnibacterium sp. TaxID=1631851 RepID=UPI0035CB0B8B